MQLGSHQWHSQDFVWAVGAFEYNGIPSVCGIGGKNGVYKAVRKHSCDIQEELCIST